MIKIQFHIATEVLYNVKTPTITNLFYASLYVLTHTRKFKAYLSYTDHEIITYSAFMRIDKIYIVYLI